MKKKIKVQVEVEQETIFCDSCGEKICLATDNHSDGIELSMIGTGYSAYGGAVDSEWNYSLCRKCATALKDFLDSGKNLQKLPESEE